MRTYIRQIRLGRFKLIHCYTGYIYHELQLGPLVFQIAKRNQDTLPTTGEKIQPKKGLFVWRDRMWR